MAVTLKSVQRLTALKNKIDGVTNIESVTLAEAIDNALAGYGQGDTTNEDGLVAGTITEYKNDRVTTIGNYAFQNRSSLVSADFPLVTTIGKFAFYGCSSLVSADFPLVTTIGDTAFHSCKLIKTINIQSVTRIERSTFQNCSSLTSINAPLVTFIGQGAFFGCSSLVSADFPSATSIEQTAFRSCSSLVSADFPLVTTIGNYALNSCSSLVSADFPLVTTIGNYAFQNCSSLKSLILRKNSVCLIYPNSVLTNTPIASGTGYIYVPSLCINDYKNAITWNTYAAQFRALEDYTVDGTTTGELDESKVNGGTA